MKRDTIVKSTGKIIAVFIMITAAGITGCSSLHSDKSETSFGSKSDTVSEQSITGETDSLLAEDENSQSESSDSDELSSLADADGGENHAAEGNRQEEDHSAAGENILSQEERSSLLAQMTILQDPSIYTYQDMQEDTEILLRLYQGLVTCDSIGTTADGRELLHFTAGNPEAEKQIFINGAIHAREYLTFQLVMKQLCVYLQHVQQQDSWGNLSYTDMWNQVCIHVVPLVNPDGVQISQFGLSGIQTQTVLDTIYSIAANDGVEITSYYLDHWKANGEGVDLNRNFDAYWEAYAGTGYPSSDHYKGTYPGSAAEAEALIRLTEENQFLYTISYHTQGRVIYWNFENIDPVYDTALQWVNRIADQTGYTPINDFSVVDPAGYSDWAIYRHQIPSVVIEVASGDSPYLSDQFQQIWNENLNIWEITIEEAMGGSL